MPNSFEKTLNNLHARHTSFFYKLSLQLPGQEIGGQNRLTISTSGQDFRNSKGVVRLALNRKGEEVVVALEPPASGTTEIMISLVGKHFLMENSIM